MEKVIMPRLDPGMKEGTIIKWLKNEGDEINKGDPITEVDGEKVVFNIEAKESGILEKILVDEKITVKIGSPIAIILQKGEKIIESEIESIKSQINYVSQIEVATPDILIQAEKPPTPSGTIRISPLARKIAYEHNIDILKIEVTDSHGRIQKKDVMRYIEESKIQEPEILEIRPLVGMRKNIADRMYRSYRNIPQLAIIKEIDVSNLLNYKEKIEKISGNRISFYSLLVKITADTIEKFMIINSTIEEGQIKIFKNINIGIAVAVEDGLIVPVIKDANKKSIIELDKIIKNLIKETQSRKITIENLKGGTFTITNLGVFGVDYFMPIINPPEAAILGIGKLKKIPIVVNEEIKIVPIMTVSLVIDHRILDGVKGAQFLNELEKRTLTL